MIDYVVNMPQCLNL